MTESVSTPCGLLGQPWFDEFIAKLVKLSELEPDWNGYGEKAIDLRSVVRAVALVALVCPEGPAPWAVPMSEGGIQLEWHDTTWRELSAASIEIEVPPTGVVTAAAFHDDTDMVAELCIVPGDGCLSDWEELVGWFESAQCDTPAAKAGI